MAHLQMLDELVKEYLLFRGFTNTVKSLDVEIKNDKEKGFRVDKIVDQILQYINNSDLQGFKEYWSHFDSNFFTKLESHFQPAIQKIEHSLYKLYLVVAVNGGRNEKVSEFFTKMLPELQPFSEWKEWFMLPFTQKPEENSAFSLYFSKQWQDTLLLSLHNLLSMIFQCMPLPTLAYYEGDAFLTKKLQDENTTLKTKLLNFNSADNKNSNNRNNIYTDSLTGPMPLMDDFYILPSEGADGGLRAARGIRGLIRSVGASSPTLSRRTPSTSSQQ